MRAGDLDRAITIEKRHDEFGSSGQPKPVWRPYLRDVPAAVEPRAGREFFAARQLVPTEAARFRIRWRGGINQQMRVIYDAKIWDIGGIDLIGRNVELHLYCGTGLTEG